MAIYLDFNATAPLLASARAAWLAAQDSAWGNPSSMHASGQQARHQLDQAKARISALLGCRPAELIVTSGGSEANALAIHAALAGIAAPAEILASAIEHSSVLRNAERAARVRRIGVDAEGRMLQDELVGALTTQTRLVCIQFANNEVGTLQDAAILSARVRAQAPHARILLDCCQGAGKKRIDLRSLDVDFASIAGHKFGAPKGVGLLYARTGVAVDALIAGGRQQQDRRSGSEDAAAVCALAAALAESLAHAEAEDGRQRALLEACWDGVHRVLPEARWLAAGAARLANTMSLAHPGVVNEHLVARLDLAGFEVSTGAACMAGRGEPSHVIAALGLERELARSVIRISIGPQTTAEELALFVAAYVREVRELVSVHPGPASTGRDR